MTSYVVDYEIMESDVGLIVEKRTNVYVESGQETVPTIRHELDKLASRARIVRYVVDDEDDVHYQYDYFC
jgi:hypothetical protein